MSRDMTEKQFKDACKKHGFSSEGIFGYYRLPAGSGGTSVSIWNAGARRRDQLAYLIQHNERTEKEYQERKAG